ncbi:MAG: tRNA-(ms[2]io[6]A)-hydroxylase [Pseudomonadales bacterium]|nr:tRNA-(ms[2]io[6]A)-hydroxylase [Pseudomonadales bacterium]
MSSDFESPLLFDTPSAWVDAVLADFDSFLLDHAAAEKKASGMAISMISHYPDRQSLVTEMADLAVEELCHYKEVIKLIHERGGQLAADQKDHYVLSFREHIRNGKSMYFLDRLIVAGIIEARGAERFQLIADALPAGRVKNMYKAIANSEKRHYRLFIELASEYFDPAEVLARADELLAIEAEIVQKLPIQAKLH